MEGDFVKLNFEKAISSKKELLNTQLHLVYTREHIKNLVRLKKQELVIKNKIKEDIISIKKKIVSVLSCFSKHKLSKGIIQVHADKSIRNIELFKRRSSIEEELLKIKSDLEKLEKKI